jgi:hypothetical protein
MAAAAGKRIKAGIMGQFKLFLLYNVNKAMAGSCSNLCNLMLCGNIFCGGCACFARCFSGYTS